MTYAPDIEALLGPAGSPPPAAEPPRVSLPARGGDAMIAGDAYEGADRYNTSLAMWSPSIRSADGEILPEKQRVDARVRDSLRNDAYVAGGATLHKDNIVGAMFALNAKPMLRVLGLDETWETEFQEEVEAKFTLYAESMNNWSDASRMGTLTDQVRLAIGVFLAGGEVLASAEWIRNEVGRPFNTAIQMLDTDRLSNPFDQMESPTLRGGVVRNRYGAPQGYHIRMAHPSDFMNPDSYVWKYVPARKPWGRLQMIHIIEQLRPDQTRGVSEMVSALKETRITKRFRDIVLQNAVVNATYAASIESDLPSDQAFAALGGGDSADKALNNYFGAYMTQVEQYSAGARNLHIDGAKIPHLLPGTKLQLRPAGSGGALGENFEQSLLRYIAANLGVSYEQLSRDYTNTNYSSARAAMNETWKYMQSRKRKVADRFASSVYQLWLEEAINKGEITSLPRSAPSWYEGQNADAYSACDWIGAGRGQIDELKETQAAVLRLKFNLSTLEDEHARQGKDWRTVFAQRQREDAEAKKRGLVLNPDSKTMNAASGSPRKKDATNG